MFSRVAPASRARPWLEHVLGCLGVVRGWGATSFIAIRACFSFICVWSLGHAEQEHAQTHEHFGCVCDCLVDAIVGAWLLVFHYLMQFLFLVVVVFIVRRKYGPNIFIDLFHLRNLSGGQYGRRSVRWSSRSECGSDSGSGPIFVGVPQCFAHFDSFCWCRAGGAS